MTLFFMAAAAAVASSADVTAERVPDADSVVVEERERVEYAPDGTYADESEFWIKVLTEKGRREEGVLSLDYNARYGKAEIPYVGILSPGEEEREIDVSGTTKDATDDSSMADNIVDPLDRKLVCTIPGVKVGDLLHIKTRRSTFKARIENEWCGFAVMEWTYPILKSVYEVKAPASLPIRSTVVRNPLGNVERSSRVLEDGSTLHVFTATNSPQMFPEPDMPPAWTQVQSVRMSTASDWRDISKWYWELCLPHISKTTAAMTNAVAAFQAEAGTNALRRIFKFVSQEVRYMGLTLEDKSPGYAPHDVDVTFENRYGVCRDKAGLLVAMLRIAGFKAYPVLINVGAKMDPDVPQPYFNHAIAAVEDGDGYMLMDPTNENTKDILPSYLCNQSYLVARPEGDVLRTSPVPPPERNSIEVSSKGALSRDGTIALESEILFSGIGDTAYRGALVRRTPEERRKFFEARARALAAGATLVSCDVEPADMLDTERPVKVRMVCRLPGAILKGVSRNTLAVPMMSRQFALVNMLLAGNTSLVERKYPLVLDTTARIHETLSLDLGDALGEAAHLPEDAVARGGYEFSRKFRVNGSALTAERTVSVSSVEFSPSEYAELRERMAEAEAAERRNPMFFAAGRKGADVALRLALYESDVADGGRSWVATNTYVKEILTYQGKKDSAEIVLPYNPSWKRVEVVSAAVSNSSGVVRFAGPAEMNEMDCAWAAAAPRYPAGRKIVVNLPSVEIGSTLYVTTAERVSGAPAPCRATYFLDADVPIDRKVVRVNGWKREIASPRRTPEETCQPMAYKWRECKTFVFGGFGDVREVLRSAARVAPVDPSAAPGMDASTVEGVRNWIARHVRIAGPAMYEVPVDMQLTPPERVLAERYATRLDYIRTMCALLRGAGFAADVVFASDDAFFDGSERRRIMHEAPDVVAFSWPVCRVRAKSGGFLGFGAEERVLFVGVENEYTPLGATGLHGADFYDPEAGEFGVVGASDESLVPFSRARMAFDARDNGAVDVTVENETFGAGVGAFRKKYAEMLPEKRSRHFQSLLGSIAKAATATSELETDEKGYPARLRFSCFVPDYAVVGGGAMTIRLPSLSCPLPPLGGEVRSSPISVEGCRDSVEERTVVFPEGYDEVESMPESFVLRNPSTGEPWVTNEAIGERRDDGRLAITVRRTVHRRVRGTFGPEFAELFRDWRRICSCAASRTVVVRRHLR